VYTLPTDDVLRGLDGEPARRAVRHIAVSAMNVTTVTLNGTSTTADARAALLGALAATAAADRHPVIAVPATPAAAARAATNPALRTVADPDQAAMSLHTRGWKLPPGALIVVDDADHCPAHRLNSLIRYAQRDNTKLVLITDHTAPPGPSRALTDALAAAHPRAHHRLGEPDTTHSIAARLRELLTSYDTLTATYRDQHQQELRFWSNWERTSPIPGTLPQPAPHPQRRQRPQSVTPPPPNTPPRSNPGIAGPVLTIVAVHTAVSDRPGGRGESTT
jgi:hypothetical protein